MHLVEPMCFDLNNDTKLRRAGLDYHDLAHVVTHPHFDDAVASIPGRIFAFTGHSTTPYTDVSYQDGDALLFGPEPCGLPEEVMADKRIEQLVRIPMKEGARSLNLTNAASIALYEALRQQGFNNLV